MDEYKAYIDRLAGSKSPDMINNSSSEHASVLASAMFKYGASGVNIFTGQLHPETYSTDYVVNQAAVFLQKGGSLRVLIQDSEDKISSENIKNHPFLNMLKKKECPVQQVSFHRVDKDVADKTPYHFMYMDDYAFRFEPNNQEPVAFASFNKPDVARKLAAIFDNIWQNHSEQIAV